MKSFPKLKNYDWTSRHRGVSETTISPIGLTQLQKLPLKVLSIENAGFFRSAS